jgi:hypothetical protein
MSPERFRRCFYYSVMGNNSLQINSVNHRQNVPAFLYNCFNLFECHLSPIGVLLLSKLRILKPVFHKLADLLR